MYLDDDLGYNEDKVKQSDLHANWGEGGFQSTHREEVQTDRIWDYKEGLGAASQV